MKKVSIYNTRETRIFIYKFSFLFTLVFIVFLNDAPKLFHIILMVGHMVYGYKVIFPISEFFKSREAIVDMWIKGYSIRFVIEGIFISLYILYLQGSIYHDFPFGGFLGFIAPVYYLYGIGFLLLSIVIKREKEPPEDTLLGLIIK